VDAEVTSRHAIVHNCRGDRTSGSLLNATLKVKVMDEMTFHLFRLDLDSHSGCERDYGKEEEMCLVAS
jgi:hypothetical protein